MDLDEPSPKRRKIVTENCIICFKLLNHKDDPVVKNPTFEGLKAILEASEIKKDHVFESLCPFKEDILNLKLKVAFHKLCRAKYTTKSYERKSKPDSSQPSCSTNVCDTPSRLSRHETGKFDIRTECFICSKPNTIRNKLTAITTGNGQSTRDNVLRAAEERQDAHIQMRMLAFPDLFAYDAKYHRKCYTCYIGKRNVASVKKRIEEPSLTVHDKAFCELKNHLNDTVFSERKTVTTLTNLREKYIRLLDELGAENPDQYKAWKLKDRLMKHYGDELVNVSFDGRSSIICSSAVTLADALKKATALLDQSNNITYMEIPDRPTVLQTDDRHILHSAAGILRKHMAMLPNLSGMYPPAKDTNIIKCGEIVPDKLYDFIEWCINENAFNNLTSSSDEPDTKNNLKTIALCHNLIAQNKRIFTSITLDLALQIHHECGSKKLIDTIHSLGYCVSYDEVRRFLTSVAIDESNTEDGIYIPKRLKHEQCVDGVPVIDAAIDNFDQNEETLDGKSTTHAMAAVLFHRGDVDHNDENIPRLTRKSLSAADRICPGFDDIQRYNKPAKRPEPPIVRHSTLLTFNKDDLELNTAVSKDLTWTICRKHDDIQAVPSWTAYNAFLSERNLPIVTTCYLPFIRAPPTDLNTIYTILIRLVQIADKIKQPHLLVTADCAIYSKAQQIMWNKPPLLEGRVTMRLGGMHMTMAFIASIGKLYGDGGLLSMLVDSDVYASATGRVMLQGKQISRAIRGLKLVQEALYRLYLDSFWLWLQRLDQTNEKRTEIDSSVRDIQIAFKARDRITSRQLTEQLESEHMASIRRLQQEFSDVGRSQSSTFAYWDTFMQGVGTLLRLMRAERDGLFELHLMAVCEVLPWCRAADRSSYARYLPCYLNDMISLREEQPNVYKYLQDGGFVVRRSSKQFNAVATDQALEQTINRDGKSQGGVIGFTLKKGALTRWMITRHVTAQYTDAFNEMCQCQDQAESNNMHIEHGKTRLARDERDVTKIVDFISNSQNPFDIDTVPDELVNIITGQLASPEVSRGLGDFLRTAHKTNTEFVEKRLMHEKTRSFWDTDTRLKTPTFTDMSKSLTSNKTDRIMVDSEVLFRRLLAVSKHRNVNLQDVLSHELAPVPPSLFNDDGTMRKTTKADLAKKLESVCDEINALGNIDDEQLTAYIIDGMAFLQALDESKFDTFNDLGKLVMQKIQSLLQCNLRVKSVTIVFDRYDYVNSIKQQERDRRSGNDSNLTFDINGTRKVPNFRKFMKGATNKSSLAAFVSNYLTQTAPRLLADDSSLTVAGGFSDGEVVRVIQHTGVHEQRELFSTHEEADTRILLHAIHLSDTNHRIIIRCDDTDVLVLLVYYCGMGMFGNCHVYMNAGHCTKITNRQRYIPINQIMTSIGREVSLCLPAAHAITGCDTTSSLYKIGKRTAYSKLVQNIGELMLLSELGASRDITYIIPVVTKYALLLYGSKQKSCTKLDELRYYNACNSDKAASAFPPTDDAFIQHIKRVNYQVAVWTNSHTAKPVLWEPDGNGWQMIDDRLEPVMFIKDAAPKEVRDLTHLYCTDASCTQSQKCDCLVAGLLCTEFCSCKCECQNTDKELLLSSSDDESD